MSNETTTLRAVVGLDHNPARLTESALLLIDCQNTYTQGVMQLSGVSAALDEAERLLKRARELNVPVIHIRHDGGAGSPYDLTAEIGQIADQVAPIDGEIIIDKNFPNSFIQTELDERLRVLGVEKLILAGFMTHMCVNSTAHGAFNLGYQATVVAAATATRDLQGADGQMIPAQQLQEATLAATRDLYAVIVNRTDDLPV